MQKIKKLKWSFTTLILSWLELIGILELVYVLISYVDVLARHENCFSWNLFKIMVEIANKI